MPAEDLKAEEALEVLTNENLVRVAFRDGDSVYLIPLGYAWSGSVLYGVMEPGRKTQIAAENPKVAFQVDTSGKTGLFEWASVTGTGRFEVVSSGDERQEALAALQPAIAEAPAWWQNEQAPSMASGALQVWKIVPERFDGRRYVPPDNTDRE
jgi:nitroimidazol reductase NimA-like FMN-containing flavoprotein (pyridoxamine 5'-phosphate oxidase superfamily)